jgi:hypothetical protein
MAARVTLKAINDELSRRGHNARLEKASGYFYFFGGEATDWIDRTVQMTTVNALTLAQWVEEFRRLKRMNQEIMRKPGRGHKGKTQQGSMVPAASAWPPCTVSGIWRLRPSVK